MAGSNTGGVMACEGSDGSDLADGGDNDVFSVIWRAQMAANVMSGTFQVVVLAGGELGALRMACFQLIAWYHPHAVLDCLCSSNGASGRQLAYAACANDGVLAVIISIMTRHQCSVDARGALRSPLVGISVERRKYNLEDDVNN